MEGEVLMVRLGSDDGGMDPDENVEQGSAFMELKSSATLLVPVELVEGQPGLEHVSQVDLPELQPAAAEDEPQSDSHSSFTLMLNIDQYEVKETTLPTENDVELSDPSSQPHGQSAYAEQDVIPLETDIKDHSVFETLQEEKGEEMELFDGSNVDGLREQELQTDLQVENTAAKLEAEEIRKQGDEQFMLHQDHEPLSGPSIIVELPAAVKDKDSMEKTKSVEEMREESKPVFAEEEQEPQGNGPADTGTETEENKSAVEETNQHEASAETQRSERRTRSQSAEEKPVEQVSISENHPDKRSVPQTPTSQRKKPAPTPTRRLTRGRTVSFVTTVPKAADEPEQDAETSSLVPVSPSRTSEKGKLVRETKVQIPTSTPRRSTRSTQPGPPKDQVDATNDISAASTSKTFTPATRSLRSTSTRTSQRLLDENTAATEAEISFKQDQEDEARDKVGPRTRSRVPTSSKRNMTQVNTPRTSSRKTTPLKMFKEEKKKEESVVRLVKRRYKRSELELVSPMKEEEEDKELPLSPRMATRQSVHLTLNLTPQVRIFNTGVQTVSC